MRKTKILSKKFKIMFTRKIKIAIDNDFTKLSDSHYNKILLKISIFSRKWQREHKNAMGSPVFGYMGGGQVKTPVMGQAPYQVTLEDRMRWAQIADVMAQANHYAVNVS